MNRQTHARFGGALLLSVSLSAAVSCGGDDEGGGAPDCRVGETRCAGACTSLATNPDHCGACGTSCAAALFCSAGACASSCDGGLEPCGRSCVDTTTDARHCGACGQACGGSERCDAGRCEPSGAGGSAGSAGAAGSAGSAGSSGSAGSAGVGGASGSAGTAGGAGSAGSTGTGGGDGGPPPDPPAATCTAPLALVDTSSPDRVVGTGSAASCTEAALRAAVTAGGKVTFDCGGPTTIAIATTIDVPIDRDVTVDGGGVVTLDGGRTSGNRTRIFRFYSPNYRAVDTVFTVQRLTLQNAEAPASDFTAQDPTKPRCAHGYKDGQGGAIFVRDGVLHVIDTVFRNNKASTPGPDTGGGGIYALGSKEVVVVGSVFEGNEGSNGGGVGLLQSDGIFVNTRFEGNVASGTGANFGGASECPPFNHDFQGGAGGNGAAVVIDGGSVARVEFCGVTFVNNTGGALGGVFRTPNSQRETMTFDRCHFDGNHTEDGGSGIYTQDMDLVIRGTTFANNTANGIGGAVRLHAGAHGSTLDMTNSTLYRNRVTRALGGGLVYNGPGSVRNCTFAENEAIGGYDATAMAAYFGGAISGGGFSVDNTVFLDNKDTHPWTPMTCNVSAPLAGSNNLQWPRKRTDENGQPSTQDDNPCTNGITWADADLGPLGDNGGAAPTLAPSTGSPARGVGTACPPFDQTGAARPSSGCTAGAVE